MRHRLRRRALAAALALAAPIWAASAPPAAACLVCYPMPKGTPADPLVAAEAIAFAREDPERPFRLSVVEMVRGAAPDADPKVFLPAMDRRRLAADPDAVAVLIRDPGSESWRRVAVGGAARRAFVKAVAARSEAWRSDPSADDRLDFFAERLDAPQDWLRRAALLELGRGPYGRIRAAAPHLPEDALREGLEAVVWLEWRPIYILMLGARGGPEAAETVREGYARALAYGPPEHRSAWATALIEVDGARGLARVVRDAGDRPAPVMSELLLAVSVQGGGGDPALRGPAAEAYASLLATRPEAAGHVARDLAAWEDWSLAPAVAKAAAAGRAGGAAGLYAAALYVGMAREAGGL